jgi:tetrahydromethanopterin S-methyltransferase subunit C
MLGVMALESQRHILDLLLQTVEKNRIQVVTNLILSSSIMLSLFLIPKFGAASMLIANALGLVVSNMIIIRHLGSSGLYYSVMKIELVKIFFGLILAVLAGNLLNAYFVAWFSAMVSFVLMLVFMVVVGLVSKGEINMLGELRRK